MPRPSGPALRAGVLPITDRAPYTKSERFELAWLLVLLTYTKSGAADESNPRFVQGIGKVFTKLMLEMSWLIVLILPWVVSPCMR